MMSKEAHPCAVLRGHQGDVQALAFDQSETKLISGDAHGEVRVWAVDDLRPRSIRRLHPASAGIINLKLWRQPSISVTTDANNSTAGSSNSKAACPQVLVTQGRDGTTHMWGLDNELNIVEGPPLRSFIREAFSFCRFSLLAAEDVKSELEDTQALIAKSIATAAAFHADDTPEAFAEAVLAGDTSLLQNKDTEMKYRALERELESSFILLNAIVAVHTCSPSPSSTQTAASFSGQQANTQQQLSPSALIAIPSHSEKVVEVCCAACGEPLAMFLQKDGQGEALPETERWGMAMATKLFIGPKEANNDILLAVGYESGHVVLWSVTAAIISTCSSAVSSSSTSTYSPPKPLAFTKLHSEPIMALDIDSDGYSGISGSAEDALISFSINYPPAGGDAVTITATATINLKKQGVADVALRPDGKLIASAGWDGKIRVYKKSSGKALAVFKYHSAAASAVAFSPRSFLIASGARDGTVALWDVYSKH